MPYVGQTGRSLSQLVRPLTQEKDFVEPSNMPRNYGGPKMSSGFCPLYKNIVTIREFEHEDCGGLGGGSEKGSLWGI